MIWIVYALLCAFFASLTDLYTKKFVSDIGSIENAFARYLFSAPVLWIAAAAEGNWHVDTGIIPAVVICIPFEMAGLIMYVKAVKISPFSKTVPFLAFTPAFLLIMAPLILGEIPHLSGAIGVIVVTVGAWILCLEKGEGFLGPFRSIKNERGSMMMLMVAFVYSVSSALGKLGVIHSSPVLFAAIYTSVSAIVMSVYLFFTKRLRNAITLRLVPVGVCTAVVLIFHMHAIKLTQVSYMISVKRTSLLFAIVYGVMFFGEKNLMRKTIAGIVMIAGVMIITFAGK